MLTPPSLSETVRTAFVSDARECIDGCLLIMPLMLRLLILCGEDWATRATFLSVTLFFSLLPPPATASLAPARDTGAVAPSSGLPSPSPRAAASAGV
jgi:hypothetical protein|eukprot:COSAG01_NODE_798_length_13503_cov_8.878395_17_plen_97_part_00